MITVELTKPPKRWVKVVGRVKFGSHFAQLVLLRDKERRQKKIKKIKKEIKRLEDDVIKREKKFREELKKHPFIRLGIPDRLMGNYCFCNDGKWEIDRLKRKLKKLTA
jgi:hypothetical protein